MFLTEDIKSTLQNDNILLKQNFYSCFSFFFAGEDYIFALLTGYCDAPAGVVLREGQYFNPYFPGGAISMAQALYNEVIEYTDGTPATASQLAKDISTFLKWTAEPEHDERKKMLIRVFIIFTTLTGILYYMKRFKFSVLKTRKIEYRPKSDK